VRSETAGATFDRMATRIAAIASHTGMTGIFRLLSADIFEVVNIVPITGHLAPPDPGAPGLNDLPAEPGKMPPGQRDELWVLHRMSSRMNQAPDLESMLAAVLDGLNEDFGFAHAKVLLVD